MSLEKSIVHGKENRKEYRGSKSFDRSFRNHGSCGHCESNRKYQFTKLIQKSKDMIQND